MLDALTTFPGALSSNPSGWSKALEIFIIALGILALAATVYLMCKHKAFHAPPGAAEEGVIRTGASNIRIGLAYAITGVVNLTVMIIDLVYNQPTNNWITRSSVYFYGLFFPIIALMNIHFSVTNRLEYDESGIRQYLGLGSRSIQWSDLETMTYSRFTRTLKLSGGRAKMYVELRNPNAPRLLKFMEERVTGENRNTVEQLLRGKPKGKSV